MAKWLKNALIEYGTTEENPGDVKYYWDYINSGTQVRQEKKEKDDIKSKLKPGSKVKMHGADGGITVIYVRPYNNQAFAGHVYGETKLYKWYYRNIKELISESWNTTNIDESTSFTTYLKEAGFTLMEYQEQVYQTCLAKGDYKNIDLYFADEIEQGYNDNKSVNEVADEICNKFDEMVNNVDNYSEADINENSWDSKYKSMQFKEAKQLLERNGYYLLEDSQEIQVNSLEHSRYIKKLIKLYNDSGYMFINDVISAVESDDEQLYVIKGEHYSIEVKVRFIIRDGKFNITIYGLDETEGYYWDELGNGVSKSFKDAANQALIEFKTNIKPLFNKGNNI